MNFPEQRSHLSDYERKRRETAAASRRGLAKHLPETEWKLLPDTPENLPEFSPKKMNTFRIIFLTLMVLPVSVLLLLFLVFHHHYSSMNLQPREYIGSAFIAAVTPEPGSAAPAAGAAILTPENMSRPEETLREGVAANEIFENEDVYNILLLGNDSRADDIAQRTDAMILISINTATKKIYLTSFLRDLYVHIPGFGSQRLNAANAVGGPGLTVDTIEQNFGIPIQNYAQVNFAAFESIIDTLGGVDIYLTTAEAQYLDVGQTGGTYHLSGCDALTYCRIRSLDSDFGRTERQRKVLKTLWTDLRDISLLDACELMEIILPQVTTDVTHRDCLNLLAIAPQILDYELISHSIPAAGTYEITMVKDMSVIVADMEENSAILRTTVYSD